MKQYTIALFAEVEEFQFRDAGANTLAKAEKYEKDFAAWKEKHGFHAADDADTIADEFREHLTPEQLEEYYSK
jgi:hypothetical protein